MDSLAKEQERGLSFGTRFTIVAMAAPAGGVQALSKALSSLLAD